MFLVFLFLLATTLFQIYEHTFPKRPTESFLTQKKSSIVRLRLTEVLSAPDVHSCVVFPQVIEPGPVDHEEPPRDDRSPDTERRRETVHTYKSNYNSYGLVIISPDACPDV